VPDPDLTSLRRVWLAFTAGIVVLPVVVLLTADATSTLPTFLPVLLVVVVGAGAAVGVVAAERALAGQRPAPEEAVGALRTQAYLQLAVGEFPLLLSVAMAFVLGPPWLVVIGAVVALAALAVGRPTPARLRRLEAGWELPPGTLTGRPAAATDDRGRPR